jgi:hypothetical protein
MAYRVLFAIGLLLLAGSVGLGAATSLRESGRLPAPSLSAVQVEGVSRERSMSDEWLAQMENLAAIQPRSISAWRAL